MRIVRNNLRESSFYCSFLLVVIGLVWYTHIKLSTTAVAPPTPPVTTTVDEEHSKEIDVELQERRSE